MTIRVVAGDGGEGGGNAPIRVRLVNDIGVDSSTMSALDAVAEESAPALFAPPKGDENESDPPADEPTELQQPAALQSLVEPAPSAQLVPPSEETTPPTTTDTDVGEAMMQVHSPVPAGRDPNTNERSADDLASESGVETSQPPALEPAPSATASGASAPSATAPYALRGASGRLGLVALQGGSAETEAAVAAALGWLAKAQSADGRWDANRFGAGQEHAVLGHDRGGAGRNADTGISALALLALLGGGQSHEHGEYQLTVRRGLEFLLRSQAVDGNLCGQSTFYAQMYCHSMATFALAEALAMTGDDRLKSAIVKAVEFSLRAQHPAAGGWRYKPGDTGDTSQLGWQMMALVSAERAGVDVGPHTWMRIGRFLKSVRRGNQGGLASYRPDGPATTSMTAEAFYCRLLLHDLGNERIDDRSAHEAIEHLLAAPPDAARINLYYWYYATLALHHRHHTDNQTQMAWQTWNAALTTALVKTQVADGPNAGSWNTKTVWGGYGGRVYTTAMAAMCLEVYYRYAPTPPSRPGGWTAARPGETTR
jgi:hypothetical protein